MNKFIAGITAALLIGATFTMTGCAKKCQDCECPNVRGYDTQEVCEDDFESREDYNDWIDAAERAGCDCTPT